MAHNAAATRLGRKVGAAGTVRDIVPELGRTVGATNAKNVTSECRTHLRRPIVLVLGRGSTWAFPYFPLGSGPAWSLVPMTDNVLESLALEEAKFVRCAGGAR